MRLQNCIERRAKLVSPYSSGIARPLILISLGLILAFSGCIWIFQTPVAESVDIEKSTIVRTPVRAHLTNGETILFNSGASISDSSITGFGTRYNIVLEPAGPVRKVPVDSIVAIESFRDQVNSGATFFASTIATVGMIVGVPALSVAIFGSCPTIYSEGDDGPILEAEAFPNSIVSLFEVRDVDPLHASADESGKVRLEIRNEALETHYINHLELLEVSHNDSATVVPAPLGMAYVLNDLVAADRATDREQRDVRSVLSRADGNVFSSHSSLLNNVTASDFSDYIDLRFPAPAGDSAAVFLQLRNSLLNTVYFYESMLSAQGSGSLNWLGTELESISYAVELGDFFAQNLGLRISVWDGESFHYAGKIGEVGPIAWDEVAVAIPVLQRDSVRVRLDFVTDSWRIDHVALAQQFATVVPDPIRPSTVNTSADVAPNDILGLIDSPDEKYLVTLPGTALTVEFVTDVISDDSNRSFMLASQGYYTEWIRKEWIEESDSTRFVPSAETLAAAMKRWRELKPGYEATFEKSKIPVR